MYIDIYVKEKEKKKKIDPRLGQRIHRGIER